MWIGDVLRFPNCELAVSEPRYPCFKFNAAMGFKHAAKLMVESAWCGSYLAVRSPGTIAAGQSFELVPGPREVGIAELFRARMRRAQPPDRARLTMLAYRHAFHAGNHADVLKHTVLMLVLRHMNAKPKAYRFVDTHAGAGGYSLEGRYAQKKGEYEAASAGSGRATTCPRRCATTSSWCAASTRTACSPSTPARRPSRRCCCVRRTSCAPSSCTRPSRRSCARPLLATAGRDRLRRRRLRRPPLAAAAVEPPRRRADRSELRRQPRLRPRHRDPARGPRPLRRGHLPGLVSAGQQGRGGAAAAPARGAGAAGLAACCGCRCSSPTRKASASPAAACSSSIRRTPCARRWKPCCRTWSRCWGSSTARTTRSTARRLSARGGRRLAPRGHAGGIRFRSRNAANSQLRMPISSV